MVNQIGPSVMVRQLARMHEAPKYFKWVRKWLDEIDHTNPLWIHPTQAGPLGVATGDLVRVETEIGHYVVRAWVTEGIRPGIVACSHHMGRWKPSGTPTPSCA